MGKILEGVVDVKVVEWTTGDADAGKPGIVLSWVGEVRTKPFASRHGKKGELLLRGLS